MKNRPFGSVQEAFDQLLGPLEERTADGGTMFFF